MSTQPLPEDPMQRALEIHRRLSTEYNLDFLNLREELTARAEEEDSAAGRAPADARPPREG